MLLEQLLDECIVHYRDRGFPDSALARLRNLLITSTRNDEINLRYGQSDIPDELVTWEGPVKELLGHFRPCPSDAKQADLRTADAAFGFSFGYRRIDPAQAFADWPLGSNNAALAERSIQLRRDCNLALYLQFEIAKAVGDRVKVEYASKPIKQGTKAVLNEFTKHAGDKVHTVVVVAHRHHYDRCRLLLEKQDICVLRPPHLYSGYDPEEAQSRVKNPEACIVNDFASMADSIKRCWIQ